MHAIEYLWRAAFCLFEDGSDELLEWVEEQKQRLYAGRAYNIVIDGDEALKKLQDQDKRARLRGYLDYLAKRIDMMNYDWLRQQDLDA